MDIYRNVMLERLLSDEDGATAVEYGIMVLLIAIVIIGAVTAIGLRLEDMFQAVVDAF